MTRVSGYPSRHLVEVDQYPDDPFISYTMYKSKFIGTSLSDWSQIQCQKVQL